MGKFRMGTLDHVHVRVPDRAAAAAWYSEHLGFEPVEEYQSWANDIDFGPLQISADDGKSMLALFEIGPGHEPLPQQAGIAFSVSTEVFAQFSRSLDGTIKDPSGAALTQNSVVDFDLCWAYNFADPWDNVYELNCYDYDAVKTALIDADQITAVRYW